MAVPHLGQNFPSTCDPQVWQIAIRGGSSVSVTLLPIPLLHKPSAEYETITGMLRYFPLLFLAVAAPAADYQLKTTPQTLAWGYYWADAKPALTVKSGDTVEVECVSVGNPQTL